MATDTGWIKLSRKIQDNFLWADKPFSKGQAWIDLLLRANHTDKKFMLGNSIIEAKRGTIITSMSKLADAWGWSRFKVKTFLELLEFEKMIELKVDNKKTALNIINYGVYQDLTNNKTTANQQQTNSKPTADQQQTNSRPTQTSNYKNYKNERIKECKNVCMVTADAATAHTLTEKFFEDFWEEYPRKVHRQSAKIEWDKLRLDEALAREIIKAVKEQKRTRQWNENGGQFVPYPETWLRGKMWNDSIEGLNYSPPNDEEHDGTDNGKHSYNLSKLTDAFGNPIPTNWRR